eukprot:2128725-Alexandrium_andersonii.AAC.1
MPSNASHMLPQRTCPRAKRLKPQNSRAHEARNTTPAIRTRLHQYRSYGAKRLGICRCPPRLPGPARGSPDPNHRPNSAPVSPPRAPAP